MHSKYGKAGSAGPARAGIKAVSTCLCAMAPSHEHQSGVLGHMAPRSDTTLSLSQGMQEPSNSCLPSQRRFLYHCLCFHPSLCFHLYLTFKCENLSPPSDVVSDSFIRCYQFKFYLHLEIHYSKNPFFHIFKIMTELTKK